MGTILASVLTARAQKILLDTGATRWAEAELFDWLNAGQAEIAIIAPDAVMTVGNIALVAGTKQSLPTGGFFLQRVIRNMGVGGTTAGDAVRLVPHQLLDMQRPGWHSDTSTLVVKNYTYDQAKPETFYVYPPQTSANYVEAEYALMPTNVSAVSNAINIPDRYAGPLLDYILYRAFSKDIELPGSESRALAHRAAMENSLGLTAKAASGSEAK